MASPRGKTPYVLEDSVSGSLSLDEAFECEATRESGRDYAYTKQMKLMYPIMAIVRTAFTNFVPFIVLVPFQYEEFCRFLPRMNGFGIGTVPIVPTEIPTSRTSPFYRFLPPLLSKRC